MNFFKKTGLRALRKHELAKKQPCALRANMNSRKNRLAHSAQGPSRKKTRLRDVRKSLQNQNGLCAPCASTAENKNMFNP